MPRLLEISVRLCSVEDFPGVYRRPRPKTDLLIQLLIILFGHYVLITRI